MPQFNVRTLGLVAISLHTATWMSTAPAQESQEENVRLAPVVVTATKRSETLEQINGAASVADRLALDDAQVTSTLELDRVFPELYMSYSATFLFPIITLRGVTSAEDFYNPALTVYVDGVPQLSTMAAQSLLGVEQVELLKGPQGTLYGKSAQGGVLNVVTYTPDDTPRFAARAGISSRDGYELQLEGAGPLVEDLLYGSVSLLANDANGDLSSDVSGDDDLGGVRSRAGSARLRLAPTGSPWELNLSARRERTTGDQDVYTLFDDYRSHEAYVLPGLPQEYQDFYQRRTATSFSANFQYDFDLWRLNVIASSQRVNIKRHFPLYAYFPQFLEHWKQNTQEIRLSTREDRAALASSSAWDAVFGLYRQEVDQSRNYHFDMVMPSFYRYLSSASSNHSESLAAYGDVTWHLTPRADLTTGLRFTHDEARTRFTGTGFAGAASDSQNTWLGHIAAGYQFTPQWRGYVNVAQGYKPLGYNLAPSTLDDADGYGRERSISYEAGLRYSGPDVRASVSLYRVDSKDVQLYGDGDMGYQTLKNVGDTRSLGVEFASEWDITRDWTLSAGGFLNDASFRSFADSSTCTDCADNDVPMAPRYGWTLSARGHVKLGDTMVRPQLSVRRTGSHYFDSANTLRQDAYTVLDASLAWNPTSHLELTFYGENLTDKDYRTYAFSYGSVGNFAQVAPGRTLGVMLTYRY